MQSLLGIDGDPLTEDLARLPLSMGGLGLRSAVRTSPAAHWASWADSLPMIQKRHPAVARLIVAQLSGSAEGLHLSGATVSRERLLDVSYVAPHVGSDCRWSAPQPSRRRWRARCASTRMAVLRKPSS